MPKSTQKITLSQSRDIPFNCLVSNVRRIEAGVSIDCLDIDVMSVVFGGHPPGLIETAIAKAVDERHRRWSEQLPQEPGDLWEALLACDTDSRHALFAHCIARSINAVHNQRPRALGHADRIAKAIDLDIAGAGWSTTISAV